MHGDIDRILIPQEEIAARVRELARERLGPHAQLVRRRRPVHETQPQRLPAVDPPAGADQVHGGRRTDQAGEALGAAPAGDEAEPHLGEPQLGIEGGDPAPAGERELEPAAEAGAVDHGQRGEGQRGEAGEDLLAADDLAPGVLQVGDGGDLREVRPHGEPLRLAGGEHRDGDPGVARERLEEDLQLLDHRRIEGVDAGAGAVEDDLGQPGAVHLQPEGAGRHLTPPAARHRRRTPRRRPHLPARRPRTAWPPRGRRPAAGAPSAT